MNGFDCSSNVIFNFLSCPPPFPDKSQTPLTSPPRTTFLQCSEERNFLRIDALYHSSEANFKIIAAETASNQLTGSFKEINEDKILGRSKSLLTTKPSLFHPNLRLKK